MERVRVREPKSRGSEIIRRVREEDTSCEITYRGRIVARLVPVQEEAHPSPVEDLWLEWDALVDSIAKSWPADVSAVEAVRAERREP
jgi:prevent-host-death family protein